MSTHEPYSRHVESVDSRELYHKPEIMKIELALSETLSTGCKLTQEICIDGGEDENGVPTGSQYLTLGS